MISRNFVENDEEKPLFQLFFLRNNENQSVIVEEVDKINYRKVKERLEQGDSIFITLKRKEKVEASLVERDQAAELWYFSHIQSLVVRNGTKLYDHRITIHERCGEIGAYDKAYDC